MSIIRQFAGQTVIYGIGSVLSRIVNYLVIVILLTYLLGEQTGEFGTYAYFYAYATVLVTLFSFRLDTALFRFGNKNENLSHAFGTSLTLVLGAAILLVLIGSFLAQPIANLIGFPNEARYVQWMAYIIAFDVVNLLPFAKLRLTNKAKVFAIYKILNVAIMVTLVLLFLILFPKLRALGWDWLPVLPGLIDWMFIANLIASAALFFLLLPQLKNYTPQVDRALAIKMLRYAFPLVIVGMANGFIQFFGVPLQKMFLGEDVYNNLENAGIYDFTRRVAGLFVLFTTAFNYAAEPFFFNNSSKEDRKELYGTICRLFVLVSGIVILGLYLGLDLIKYLADSNYWGSLHLLPILLMAYLFLGIYYNVSIWYKLADKTSYGAMISIVGVIITLFVSIVFLPRIGFAASAWAALLTYLVMLVIGYVTGQKNYPIAYPVASIVKDVLVISLILLVAHWVRGEASVIVKYAANCVLLIGYLTYVWTTEKDEWKRMLRRG